MERVRTWYTSKSNYIVIYRPIVLTRICISSDDVQICHCDVSLIEYSVINLCSTPFFSLSDLRTMLLVDKQIQNHLSGIACGKLQGIILATKTSLCWSHSCLQTCSINLYYNNDRFIVSSVMTDATKCCMFLFWDIVVVTIQYWNKQ